MQVIWLCGERTKILGARGAKSRSHLQPRNVRLIQLPLKSGHPSPTGQRVAPSLFQRRAKLPRLVSGVDSLVCKFFLCLQVVSAIVL